MEGRAVEFQPTIRGRYRKCDKNTKLTRAAKILEFSGRGELLQDALLELMAERSFESITIGDITETAKVNHATFYRHYRDKYHLAEAIFTAAIESIPIDEIKPDSPDFQRAWATFFKHIEKNDRLYRTLLGLGRQRLFPSANSRVSRVYCQGAFEDKTQASSTNWGDSRCHTSARF